MPRIEVITNAAAQRLVSGDDDTLTPSERSIHDRRGRGQPGFRVDALRCIEARVAV
jgi:hypothetical protein